MKAYKITKIDWVLPLNEDKETINLPKELSFFVDDSFNVNELVPIKLKNKYGYDVDSFTITECRVAETIEDILNMQKTSKNADKSLFTSTGSLSVVGKECMEKLYHNVKYRIALEKEGTSFYDMPKHLDETRIAFEKITGNKWKDFDNAEDIINVFDSLIQDKVTQNILKNRSMNSVIRNANKMVKEMNACEMAMDEMEVED